MNLYPVPYISFDTNCLNAKGRLPEMNQIDKWHEQQLVDLGSSEALWRELPDGPGSMRDKACETGFRGGEDYLSPNELALRNQIRTIVFPQKKDLTIQDVQDIQHLFDHIKYQTGQAFFVSNDKNHILRHKDELMDQCGILVGTPAQCLAWATPLVAKAREWMKREEGPSNR